MISDFGGQLKTYQTLFILILPYTIWQTKNKVAKMIKERDQKIEGFPMSSVVEMMEHRFNIVNMFTKLGLVDLI
jgi:hypothetical protein